MIGQKAERTCIACGRKTNKHELKRLVRTPSGQIRFDETGNAAGRGAYVCGSDCFDKAVEQRRFARALRMKVDDCFIEAIKEALDPTLEG